MIVFIISHIFIISFEKFLYFFLAFHDNFLQLIFSFMAVKLLVSFLNCLKFLTWNFDGYFSFLVVIYMNRSETYEEDGLTKIDSSKFSGKLGITTELCAGIVDKNLSLQEIVQEEIMEECGYKVPLDNIERVVSYRYETFFIFLLHCLLWKLLLSKIIYKENKNLVAQLAGAVEYTDCFSAEG